MVIPNYTAHNRVNGTAMAKTSPAPMAGASVSLLSISQTPLFSKRYGPIDFISGTGPSV